MRTPRRNPPCKRPQYWGRGGAGVLFTCSEDGTVLLLLRAEWVEQGGTWGIPGGGVGEGFYRTPMEPITDLDVFRRKAQQEAEEECGGLPPGMARVPEGLPYTQYEDCGFRYTTFILDIPKAQKDAWRPYSADGENDAFVWFPLDKVKRGRPLPDEHGDLHDIHFGVKFTMANWPRANPRRAKPRTSRLRRNPDAPFRFSSGAEAEQAALAARPAVLADPEFRSWFGRSEVVDAEGKPLIVYHGTNSTDAFTEFSDEDAPDRGGLIAFFSSSPAFAQGYGKNVYPVYLRCYDVFDFRDAQDARSAVDYFYDDHGGIQDDYEARRILMGLTGTHPEFADLNDISDTRYDASDLTKELFLEAVLEGSWDALEANEFVEYLREGWSCDGIVLLEHGAINYGIFDAEDVKSATANRGTYDGGDPDILANPRPRRLRRNPEDRAHIRDLLARLQDFKENVMEAAGDDPYETAFDPMEYPIYDDTLASYLGATVLGWGASRVVVLLPSGNVAKLPWTDEIASNEQEWENWQQASEEVQAMLLPPLEYVSGVLVFPRVKTVHDRDYDDPELSAARAKWKRLWSARAPGANAQDFQNTQNWGIYDGRVVLIDYAD